jgi:hypothetical protein
MIQLIIDRQGLHVDHKTYQFESWLSDNLHNSYYLTYDHHTEQYVYVLENDYDAACALLKFNFLCKFTHQVIRKNISR